MTSKRRRKTYSKSAISEAREAYIRVVLKEGRWKDLKQRYSSLNVFEYIKKSCNDGYLIEAYCITQQYIILSLRKIFPRLGSRLREHRLSDRSLIVFLNGIEHIDDKLYSLWNDLIDQRNDIAHDLIDHPKKIEKLSGREKEKIISFLIKCVDSVDQFYVDNFNKMRLNIDDPRAAHLLDIAANRLRSSGIDILYLLGKEPVKAIKLVTKEVKLILPDLSP